MESIVIQNNRIKPLTLIIADKNLKKLNTITNVVGIVFTDNDNSADELSCDVYYELSSDFNPEEYYRLLDENSNNLVNEAMNYLVESSSNDSSNKVICNFWDKLVDFAIVYLKETDTFYEIKVTTSETNILKKTIIGTSLCEAELSSIKLYNIEINTESDILREDYKIPSVIYREDDPDNSILNRIFEKAPHYTIGHVDISLMNIQRSFSFDGVSIYDALNTIAKEINCIFKFDSTTRTINCYDLLSYCYDCEERNEIDDGICPNCNGTNIRKPYGNDSGVFIDTYNLANEITVEKDTSNVFNTLKLKAGDELFTATVRTLNPNGSDYIYYFNTETLDSMPSSLSEKLIAYDNLVDSYNKNYQINFTDSGLMASYNALIDKYNSDTYKQYKYNDDGESVLTNNSFSKIDGEIKGFNNLINLYYDLIDFKLYLQSSLMPTIIKEAISASEDVKNLTEENLSPLALSTVTLSTSQTTVESAIKNIVKLYVYANYKITVSTTTWDYVGEDEEGFHYGEWYGTITLQSYSDENDTGTTGTLKIIITDNYEEFLEQKVLKKIADSSDGVGGIYDLISIDYVQPDTVFENQLKLYSQSRLTSFHDAYRSALDILIEMDQASAQADFYNDIYLPFYNRWKEIGNELDLRNTEINIADQVNEIIQNLKNEVQLQLDLQNYLGEDDWKTFCSYRREDVFENQNYISDGLDNATLIKNAMQFLDVAKKQSVEAGTPQITITISLQNLFLYDVFKPLIDNFNTGNWARTKVDGQLYKLRLSQIQIDSTNLSQCGVLFSSLRKKYNCLSDTQSILDSAKSISNSFSYVEHQVNQNKENNQYVSNWIENGLDATLKIVNNSTSQEVVYDKNGILVRTYDDIEEKYSPEQLKIMNSTIAITDDDWKTVMTAIGKFYYKDPVTGEMKITYGVNAQSLIGKLILGENLGIYNENNTLTFDENGLILNTISNDGSVDNIFTIKKGDETLMYIDENGQIVLGLGTQITWGDIDDIQSDSLSNVIYNFKQTIDGYESRFESIEETIQTIDVAQILVTATTQQSTTLVNDDQTVTLTAQVLYKGYDTSDEYEDVCFDWTRVSNDTASDTLWNNNHKSMKSITITTDDVEVNASFSVTAKLPSITQTSLAVSVLDTTDVPDLEGYLSTPYPVTQILRDDGTLVPNWTNLTIIPVLLDKNKPIDIEDVTITWKRKVGNGLETDLTNDETVSGNIVTISTNLLTKENPIITYIAYCTYKSVPKTISITFSLVNDGESATILEVYSTNGVSFKNGNINTELYAVVRKGSLIITDLLDSQYFIWTRTSNNTENDEYWNQQHSAGTKSIIITSTDVIDNATFTCTYNDEL